MDRRNILAGGAVLAAATLVQAARAADDDMHAHHHHQDMPARGAALAAAASECLQTGQVCLDHCLVLLGDGDKDIAACAKSVTQMQALCGALQNLANADSPYLAKLAAVTQQACRDCEAECKKHADKHRQCKDCQESCAKCARECERLAT